MVDRNFFVPDNVVDPWKIGFVPRTVRFNWNNIPANAPHPTWPGTTSSTNATISEDVPTVEFGAIVVAILEEIERSTYLHQTLRMIETPYSRVLPIENALLNQYAFWRTMAVWRGDNYAGKYFRTAVENQTGLTFPEINGKEEFRLNGEAVDLWLATENIMVNAGVVAPLAGKRYSSVRLLTEMGADPCEQSALRYIDLRYACLASCRGKLDALVTVQREVTALEFADSLSPADSLLLQSKRTELITARTALSQCEGETLPFCSIVEDYAEERGCSVEVARWAETGSQIDRPWDQLKLLHPSMKITAEEAALAHNAKDNIAGDLTKKKFPIWIPIAGAAAIGGGIIILTDGDSTPPDSMPPPELQVLNDAYILECGMSGIISPLDNDTGEELSISSVGAIDGATVNILADGTLEVSDFDQSDNFIFFITVRDRVGQTATSSVNITVTFPNLTTSDDSFTTEFETQVSGNLITNDSGEGLSITANSAPNGGTLTLNTNGDFTYLPDLEFFGTVSFDYTVSDRCGQESSATVTIEVALPPCEPFGLSPLVDNTVCGDSIGQINIVTQIPDNYTYSWSTGEAINPIIDLAPGTYSVTVTSSDGRCTDSLTNIVVQEDAPVFTSNAFALPGNCAEGGNIAITFLDLTQGPFIIEVNGPDGSPQILANTETINLADFFAVVPGQYQLAIYPQVSGSECAEVRSFTVEDDTPAFILRRDTFTTAFQTPITANVFDNDEGLMLDLLSIDVVMGGMVDPFDEDGNFTFTPDQGFVGEATFEYFVTDGCGDEATGNVVIIVSEFTCDIDASFTITEADCGFSNGNAAATVTTPGMFSFFWSNGSSEMELGLVQAGDYSLTITSTEDPDCSMVFPVNIPERPLQYVDFVQITPASCAPPGGDIMFELSSPGGQLNIVVTLEGNTQTFTTDAGNFLLSDQMLTSAGDYDFQIFPVTAGDTCAEVFTLTIPDENVPLVAVNDTFQTAVNTPLTANMLANDQGNGLRVVLVVDEI
ncbi:MAG: Ig-like domain-containing protein, partial [Bacteroidota bacterium]